MANINNPAIIAILAVIALALQDPACTPDQTAALNDAEAKLAVLDAQETLAAQQASETQQDLTARLNIANANLIKLEDSQELELQQAGEVIGELKSQLAAAISSKAAGSTKPVGELNGVQYQVHSGANGYGTAEEIAADPNKLEAILKFVGQTIVSAL